MGTLKRFWSKTWIVDGRRLSADISPCSWMYPGYGLQIQISLDNDRSNGASLFRKIPKPFDECSEADAEALCSAEPLEFVPCACGGERLKGSRDGTQKCERCFLKELMAEIGKDNEKSERAERRADAKAKRDGFAYKVRACVHPRAGGDDYFITYYFTEKPTRDQITALLSKRSRVPTDFRDAERL